MYLTDALLMCGRSFRAACLKKNIAIRAFQQFFSYQSLNSWEQVVENAFCSDSTSITAPLTVCTHLIKLVEAAHLVDVREVTHVGECLKNGR